MRLQDSLTGILVQYLADMLTMDIPPPTLISVGGSTDPQTLSPNIDLPLYSLYEDEKLPTLSEDITLEMILVKDTTRASTDELARHFNLDPQEVAWFFTGDSESTAAQWAGSLSIDTDQDAEDYEDLTSELLARWEACTSMGVSYVFWTRLLTQAMQALAKGESHPLKDMGFEAELLKLNAGWEENRKTERRWLARRGLGGVRDVSN